MTTTRHCVVVNEVRRRVSRIRHFLVVANTERTLGAAAEPIRRGGGFPRTGGAVLFLGRKRARTDEHPVLATPGDREFGGRAGDRSTQRNGRGSVYPYTWIEYKPLCRAANWNRTGAGVHEPATPAAALGGLGPGAAGDVHAPGSPCQARIAPAEALVSLAVHVRASVDAR